MGNRQSSEVYVFKVNQRDFPEIPDATNAEISQFQASALYQNQTYLFQKQLQNSNTTRLISKPLTRLSSDEMEILKTKVENTEHLENQSIHGLPNLTFIAWKKIIGKLEPLDIFRIRNICLEFHQPAIDHLGSSLEIFENRRTLIEEEIDRGIRDENGGNFLEKVPKISHLLFIDTDRARTLGVTHLRPDIVTHGRAYLTWDEYDVFLKTKFLRLNSVCWLQFSIQMTLPPREYMLFYKMRSGRMYTDPQTSNTSVQNEYEIKITMGTTKYRGFLDLDTLRNLRSDRWTWVPVLSASNGDGENFRLFLEGEVQIELFNQHGYWTRGLCWHGLTAVVADAI